MDYCPAAEEFDDRASDVMQGITVDQWVERGVEAGGSYTENDGYSRVGVWVVQNHYVKDVQRRPESSK